MTRHGSGQGVHACDCRPHRSDRSARPTLLNLITSWSAGGFHRLSVWASGVRPRTRSHHLISRRQFIVRVGHAAVATAGVRPMTLLPPMADKDAVPVGGASQTHEGRGQRAYEIRQRAAAFEQTLRPPEPKVNGDEALHATQFANFCKGLPHTPDGEVDPAAYRSLLDALTTGSPTDFERIPLGGFMKLANPQAAFAYSLQGPDSHGLRLKPPPGFQSAEQAGEMVELYWQALTRDVAFTNYNTDPRTNEAAEDLSSFKGFSGPKVGDRVAPYTLFRGMTPGDLIGPYISQFLWKELPYGAMRVAQKIRTAQPGYDYMVTFPDWLAAQQGLLHGSSRFDPVNRYVRNGRDLAQYVHVDQVYQAFLNACLILLDMDAPIDRGDPYRNSTSQSGFVTFGSAAILDLVARVANCSLMAAWYQKWLLHRRLRPEEFAGRIHNHITRARHYPLPDEILKSSVLDLVFRENGTYFLPIAYPEGCPIHPSYPAGHGAIAGACTTVLKAFFNEATSIRDPVLASSDGESLIPYNGVLTVGGELNKLASNVCIGRNFAGIHWRSDSIEGLKLGETVAIRFLTEMRECFSERFAGFSLTRFDGTSVIV
jgi:membrane-associated phospholipid phosphatase